MGARARAERFVRGFATATLRRAFWGSMALAAFTATGVVVAAPATMSTTPHVLRTRVAPRTPPRPIEYLDAPTKVAAAAVPWAASLPSVDVRNRTTGARAKVRLYRDDGELDSDALRLFMQVAASESDLPDLPNGDVAEPLAERLVQLAFRAAYHFKGAPIVIVSATRKGSHGKHGTGDALDFQLTGVRAANVAAYARRYARAGVGIYTHPKTQFVHVDVRDRSFHWIDGSPPGVTWREKRLRDRTQAKRDASWVSAMDLPEGATP